jgi:hypothetical protein
MGDCQSDVADPGQPCLTDDPSPSGDGRAVGIQAVGALLRTAAHGLIPSPLLSGNWGQDLPTPVTSSR